MEMVNDKSPGLDGLYKGTWDYSSPKLVKIPLVLTHPTHITHPTFPSITNLGNVGYSSPKLVKIPLVLSYCNNIN
jgi:hypothetical protein